MKSDEMLKIPDNLIRSLNLGEVEIWDVRTPMEFIHGHIEGALSMPLDNMDWFLSQAGCCDKTIVTCSSGDNRSSTVYQMLKSKGVDVIDGGNWEHLNILLKDSNVGNKNIV